MPISTRRFIRRPSGVALVATGRLSPCPRMVIRWRWTATLHQQVLYVVGPSFGKILVVALEDPCCPCGLLQGSWSAGTRSRSLFSSFFPFNRLQRPWLDATCGCCMGFASRIVDGCKGFLLLGGRIVKVLFSRAQELPLASILNANKLVPDTADSLQEFGRRRIIADFLADAGNVNIDTAVVSVVG